MGHVLYVVRIKSFSVPFGGGARRAEGAMVLVKLSKFGLRYRPDRFSQSLD
jgi:hypothetical protein